MTNKEIDFFLSLKKDIKYAPFMAGFFIILFISNAYFEFSSVVNRSASIVGVAALLPWFVQSILRETSSSRSFAIIEKFVNKDPELIERVNNRRSNKRRNA
ncbi:hypothetical protein [Microbulbifer sp. JMSA003]|uniref:hypothetical protein n=1 Tax=Microbulbifer sp. JMSA003 TaxID=3243369 RepID=UPI0040391B0A